MSWPDAQGDMGQTYSRRRSPLPHSLPLRSVALILTFCTFMYTLLVLVPSHPRGFPLKDSTSRPSPTRKTDAADSDASPKGRLGPSTLENRSLTASRCRELFPLLTREIDDAAAEGPFDLRPGPDDGKSGTLLAQIRNGKEIWILDAPRKGDLSQDMRKVSHQQCHRARPQILRGPPAHTAQLVGR